MLKYFCGYTGKPQKFSLEYFCNEIIPDENFPDYGTHELHKSKVRTYLIMCCIAHEQQHMCSLSSQASKPAEFSSCIVHEV